MTNFEHYSKLYPELMIELLSNNRNHNMLAFNVAENKPVACYNMGSFENCPHCKFYNGGTNDRCKEEIKEWLEAPYEGTDNASQGGISW